MNINDYDDGVFRYAAILASQIEYYHFHECCFVDSEAWSFFVIKVWKRTSEKCRKRCWHWKRSSYLRIASIRWWVYFRDGAQLQCCSYSFPLNFFISLYWKVFQYSGWFFRWLRISETREVSLVYFCLCF